MSLKGKTLFITGASRGIGLAIALRAARDGANIVIAAKTETPHPKLEGTIHSAADVIEQAGGQALPLVVDVRDEVAVKGAMDAAVRFPRLWRTAPQRPDCVARVRLVQHPVRHPCITVHQGAVTPL
jgi:NAD(P)-dependent dehydrogenase (short-subunit alcohol dehydrogenase family)